MGSVKKAIDQAALDRITYSFVDRRGQSNKGGKQMSGKKEATRYTAEFKLEAVRLYLGGMSSPRIAEMLGIAQAVSVRRWVAQYKEQGPAAFGKALTLDDDNNRTSFDIPSGDLVGEVIRLRAENTLLKKLRSLERGDADTE